MRHSIATQAERSSFRVADWLSSVTIASVYRPLVLCLLTLAFFCNITEMSDGTDATRATAGALSIPLLARLIMAACVWAVGLFALIFDTRVRAVLQTLPGLLFIAVGIGFIVSAPFALAEVFTISVAASIIYFGYLMFAAAVVAELEIQAVIKSALVALTAFLIVTWTIYLFVPSIGVFHEHMSMTETVPRMGGTTHPNGVGLNAAIAILLSVAMIRSLRATNRESLGRQKRSNTLWLVMLGVVLMIAVGALIESRSRTSLIALAVSGFALMFDQLRGRRLVLCAVIIGSIGLGTLFAVEVFHSGEFVSDKLISTVTKTGRAEELTSATGRTEIWSAVLAAIAERPIFGWGLDSAASVGIEAGSTHNLILNVTLSAGALVGMVCVGLLLWTGWAGLRSGEPAVRAVCAYVLISGLVEDTVFESFPAILTMLWTIFLLWTCVKTVSIRTANSEQGMPPSEFIDPDGTINFPDNRGVK